VFHQQAVDEDVSATDAAQEDQVNAVVEEGMSLSIAYEMTASVTLTERVESTCGYP
jgi:hypothetical protein